MCLLSHLAFTALYHSITFVYSRSPPCYSVLGGPLWRFLFYIYPPSSCFRGKNIPPTLLKGLKLVCNLTPSMLKSDVSESGLVRTAVVERSTLAPLVGSRIRVRTPLDLKILLFLPWCYEAANEQGAPPTLVNLRKRGILTKKSRIIVIMKLNFNKGTL